CQCDVGRVGTSRAKKGGGEDEFTSLLKSLSSTTTVQIFWWSCSRVWTCRSFPVARVVRPMDFRRCPPLIASCGILFWVYTRHITIVASLVNLGFFVVRACQGPSLGSFVLSACFCFVVRKMSSCTALLCPSSIRNEGGSGGGKPSTCGMHRSGE
ncbi:hypothetical protein EDB84DRAFT_1613749, partial [Lactarius hengduanensis]